MRMLNILLYTGFLIGITIFYNIDLYIVRSDSLRVGGTDFDDFECVR